MSYRFESGTSYTRLRRYAAQAIGGLKARKVFEPIVTTWFALKQRIAKEREVREQADDAVLEASTAARVEDADNDNALTDVSAKSWELSDKDASKDPHATLFGKLPAKRVKGFGPGRALEESDRIVKDGRRFSEHDFGTTLDTLEGTSRGLDLAYKAFEATEDGLFEPRKTKKALIRAVNDLIAITEAAILTQFPGRDDIVSAILKPWFERKQSGTSKGTAGEDPTLDPLTPDVDDRIDEA